MSTAFEVGAAIKLREVFAVKTLRGEAGRLGLKLIPITEVNATKLIYERHRLLRGLQGVRGENGPSSPAKLPGFDQFEVEPGFFGDHYTITEKDLINRREVGDWETFDSEKKITAKATTLLNQRYLDRVEYNIWTMLLTGALTITDDNGTIQFYDIYDIQKSTASPAFDQLSTAAPLKYFRELIAALELGKSVNFRGGEIIMNQTTLNTILGNTNANDFGGLRMASGANFLSVSDWNKVLVANDLPTITVYNEGYYENGEGGAFTRFIPTGKALLLGKRTDGEQVGEYRLTRAAQNDNSGPGVYFTVEDMRKKVPAFIQIESGHNGGTVLYYPEAVCGITLY